jgi:SHAQKYF class myb-like DNA-binding protein
LRKKPIQKLEFNLTPNKKRVTKSKSKSKTPMKALNKTIDLGVVSKMIDLPLDDTVSFGAGVTPIPEKLEPTPLSYKSKSKKKPVTASKMKGYKPWTSEEKTKFIDAVREHGKNWKKLDQMFISTRTSAQLRSHGQSFKNTFLKHQV